MLARVATDVLAAQAELNRLDGVAGDGDLGVTMATAAAALLIARARARRRWTSRRRCAVAAASWPAKRRRPAARCSPPHSSVLQARLAVTEPLRPRNVRAPWQRVRLGSSNAARPP